MYHSYIPHLLMFHWHPIHGLSYKPHQHLLIHQPCLLLELMPCGIGNGWSPPWDACDGPCAGGSPLCLLSPCQCSDRLISPSFTDPDPVGLLHSPIRHLPDPSGVLSQYRWLHLLWLVQPPDLWHLLVMHHLELISWTCPSPSTRTLVDPNPWLE
jgi:hypothetical protein